MIYVPNARIEDFVAINDTYIYVFKCNLILLFIL